MKTMKRVAALLLCVVMACVLAGCGDSNKEQYNTTLNEYQEKISAETETALAQFDALGEDCELEQVTTYYTGELTKIQKLCTEGITKLNGITQLGSSDEKLCANNIKKLNDAYRNAYKKLEKAYAKRI